MAAYTYSIFDSDPSTSGGCEWPGHSNVEIEADSNEEAIEEVEAIMASEAKGLNPEDGYDVGQTIYGTVWSEDGTIVGSPTYELTTEDLGVVEIEEES